MSWNDEAKNVTVHFSCLIVCNPTLANDVFSWICLGLSDNPRFVLCVFCVFRVSLDIEIRYVISQSKQIKLKEKIGYFEESRIFPQSLQVLFQFI